MKITIIGTFPPYRGGIAHFNSILTRTLQQRHTVNAINFTVQYPSFLFPGKSQYSEDRNFLEVPNERLLSSINPLSWIRTAKVVANTNPDLVIFKYWMSFFAPAFGVVVRGIKKRSNAKILVICDNVIPHEHHWFDTLLTRFFFDRVDYFGVMSKSVENDLLRLYPFARYIYSPHPIYNIFGKPINKERARQQLGITASRVILYFGYIRQYKGLDVLIRAVAQLKNKLGNFVVLAVGECYESPKKYQDLVQDLNIGDVFNLQMEFIPDKKVSLYFSAADIVVLPYKSATQSGIVQIAYHFNKPVVVTNVGGLPEMVVDGETGYGVPPNDPQAVAYSIIDFYENNRNDNMVNHIISYKDRFSWSYFAQKIEELT